MFYSLMKPSFSLAALTFGAILFATSAVSGANEIPAVSNQRLSIEFHPVEKGAGIAQISDASGFRFINAQAESSALWELTLKRIPTSAPAEEEVPLSLDPELNDGSSGKDDAVAGEEIKLTPHQAPTVQVEAGKTTLSWQGLDVGEEKAVLDVWVTFTTAEADPFIRVRAGFVNRSEKYTAFYFQAPRVAGLASAGAKHGDDYLASPVDFGRLIRNPVANGLLNKPARFQPNRSGHSMQFDAYYQDGHGLYLGVFDGELNAIRYALAADKKAGLSWAPAHIPNTMKQVPQHWQTPYDVVLTSFTGDWFDACQIYRTWALQQDWTKEGPIATRQSTPDWFKNVDEWLLAPVSKGESLYGDTVQSALDPFSVGLFVTGWGWNGYFHKGTPDRFPLRPLDEQFIKKAAAAGYPLMGYIQAICWDIESKSFQERDAWKHSVQNFYNQKMVWDFSTMKGEPSKDIIANPGDVWADALGSAVEEMARQGFKAAYFDSGNHGGTYLNFNPAYSKDSGGGRYYIAAHRKLLRTIKERVRKVEPGFCFTAESFWEGNMAELDAYMVCNTTNNYLDEKNVFAIPMVPAVYHDYTIFCSAWVGKFDLEQEQAAGYLAKFGQAFVWGVKAGWNQATLLTEFKNHEIAMASSVKRYKAYSKAKKFLLDGKMLREPKVTTEGPDMKFKWHVSWRSNFYNVSTPPVMASAWEAPDGAKGIVLYNASLQPQTVTVDLSAYGIEAPGKTAQTVYGDDASSVTIAGQSLSVTLAPASPAVWEFR
jgi:hypothetical protein